VPTVQLQQRALRPLKAGLLTPKADALNLGCTELNLAILRMVQGDK
jgi:hypothetical protein